MWSEITVAGYAQGRAAVWSTVRERCSNSVQTVFKRRDNTYDTGIDRIAYVLTKICKRVIVNRY